MIYHCLSYIGMHFYFQNFCYPQMNTVARWFKQRKIVKFSKNFIAVTSTIIRNLLNMKTFFVQPVDTNVLKHFEFSMFQ